MASESSFSMDHEWIKMQSDLENQCAFCRGSEIFTHN